MDTRDGTKITLAENTDPDIDILQVTSDSFGYRLFGCIYSEDTYFTAECALRSAQGMKG